MSVAASVDVKLRWFKLPKIQSYSVDITKSVESSLSFEGDLEGKVKLGKFNIPIGATGASVDVYVFAEIDANGKSQLRHSLKRNKRQSMKMAKQPRHTNLQKVKMLKLK